MRKTIVSLIALAAALSAAAIALAATGALAASASTATGHVTTRASTAAVHTSARAASSAASVTPPPVTCPNSAPELGSVAFTTPERGYALFTAVTGGRYEELAASTTDGGAVYGHPAKVLSYNCADSSPAAQLAVDGHGDGFVYDPDLFVTHDGGKTWARSVQPGRVLSVEAIGTSVWMVEAVCPHSPAATSACKLTLLQSANGGRTWHTAAVPAKATVPLESGENISFSYGQTWLIRTGPSSGYLLSDPQGTRGIEPLWYTANSGRTWSARQLPCGRATGWYAAASVAPSGTLFAVCAGEPGVGLQTKVAARSANGGRTWALHGCPNGQLFCRITLTNGYLGQIDAVSASTVYLVGDRSQLTVTRDGGAKWQAVSGVTANDSGGTGQVLFFGTRDGIVTGNDANANERIALWHTSDGGKHWTVVVPRVS